MVDDCTTVRPIAIVHFDLWHASILMGLMIVVLGILRSGMKISRWERAMPVALGSAWYLLDLST